MSPGRARVALVVASALTCAFVFGCPRPPPPPPEVKAGPPPIVVPPGCEQNLTGVYAYGGREDWKYEATDDGGTLVLVLARTAAIGGAVAGTDGGSAASAIASDAGAAPSADGGGKPARTGSSASAPPGQRLDALDAAAADAGAPAPSTVAISLMRTPQGFVGGIEHTAFPAPGAQCTIVFPTELTACDDAGLVIASVESVDVDQSCQSPPSDGGAPRKSHRLLRVAEPAAPDAGGTP